MRKPNFFIIGAPKCGTTSLAAYLSSHPNVFMCDPKEPHFFNTDMTYRGYTHLDDYLALFAGATAEHLCLGEASVSYLHSAEAVPNIVEFSPSAKFIVLLRNPIDVAHALHSESLWSGQEDVPDFQQAWELQDSRRRGENIPKSCSDPVLLQYRSLSSLGTQLERLLTKVPRSSVHMIIYEDFRDRTQEMYLRTLDFLKLRDDGRDMFEIHNRSKKVRSRLLARGLRRLAAMKAQAENVLGAKVRFGLFNAVTRINTVADSRAPLSEQFRTQLAVEFRDEVGTLSELLQRDLSGWLKVPASVREQREHAA